MRWNMLYRPVRLVVAVFSLTGVMPGVAVCVRGSETKGPAAAKQGVIPSVSSLAQFRALPALVVKDGWELRLGVAEPGIDDAPWKLLYAHYRYVGDEQDFPAFPRLGYYTSPCVLGPLGWRVDYAPPGGLVKWKGLMVTRVGSLLWIRKSRERVYCATVPTPLVGTYPLRVGTAEEGAEGKIVVDKPPALAWTPLFHVPEQPAKGDAEPAPGSRLALDRHLRVAVPCYCDEPIWWPGDEKEDELRRSLYAKTLPGQCPAVCGLAECGPRETRHRRTGSPAEPVRFDLNVREGRLVLTGEPAQVESPRDFFLARWWVRGKPVTDSLDVARTRLARAWPSRAKLRPPDARAELAVPLVLPRWMSARVRAGDEVGLQVLYCPAGWTEMLDPAISVPAFTDRPAGGALLVPALTRRIDFRVTAGMLAQTAAGGG